MAFQDTRPMVSERYTKSLEYSRQTIQDSRMDKLNIRKVIALQRINQPQHREE